MNKYAQLCAITFLICTLNACSPKLDWRKVSGNTLGIQIPFIALMPAKPAFYSRDLVLEKTKITMLMVAAEADQISFSIGSAKVQKKEQQQITEAMKQGMLKNIDGKEILSNHINRTEAVGKLKNGQTIRFVGQFSIHGEWVNQAIIMGPEKNLTSEVIDMFFDSIKFNVN